MKSCSKIIFVLSITIFYIMIESCTNETAHLKQLQQIDSLMEENPQAAYDSLLHYAKFTDVNKQEQTNMYSRLLLAKAQNKLYLQMPSDSIFQEVVNYYDKKGTDNQKMMAYYLMGCIYRDQNEAPKAMQYYQKSVEFADTISRKCDYNTLFRVYGQIAELYKHQHLHGKAIAIYHKYSIYAKKANDNEAFIGGYQNMIPEYYSMGDTLQAIKLIKKCNLLYTKYGMKEDAVRVYSQLIYVLLNRKLYKEANYYMQLFENKSGLFNGQDIAKGYEHYYKAKGLYSLGVNKLDSALHYFYKLRMYGYEYESNSGLLAVYCKLHNNDSIEKYSVLCEAAMDKILNKSQAKALLQAKALYDYSRLQNQVERKKHQVNRLRYLMGSLCLVIIMVSGIIYILFRKNRSRKMHEFSSMTSKYQQVIRELNQAQEDLETLKQDADKLVKQKQDKINALQLEVNDINLKYAKINLSDKKLAFYNSEIFKLFKEKALPKLKNACPTIFEWETFASLFYNSFPAISEKMSNVNLSTQEERVCMLVWTRFDNSDMAVLLHTTTKVISNAKSKANLKLFGNNSATTLLRNFQQCCK